MTLVTRDATSGKWLPASNAEATSWLAGRGSLPNPQSIYNFQEVSGSAQDANSVQNMSVGGGGSPDQAISGWMRVAMSMTGAGAVGEENTAGPIGDPYANSQLVMLVIAPSAFGTNSGTQDIVGVGGATAYRGAAITSGGALKLIDLGSGNEPVGSFTNYLTTVRVIFLQVDRTHSIARIISDQETLTQSPYNAPGTTSLLFTMGAAATTSAKVSLLYGLTWHAANAELSATQISYILDCYNNGPAVASTAIAPDPFTLNLVGDTQQLTATATREDGSTFDVTSTATWVSSNTAAATVNSSGLVTAIGSGTSTITASVTSLGASPASGTSACTVIGFISSTYTPPTLFDPVPGNVGLIGDSIVLLHLNEPAGVFPADSSGNLNNLGSDSGTTAPTPISCWADNGRRFRQGSTNALYSTDTTAGDTLDLRDISVQFILAPTFAGVSGSQTIIQRGDHDGTGAEAIAYGLEILEPAGGQIEFRWFWEDSAGTIHTQAGGVYMHPGDGEFVLLTATRRWNSPTSVTCRYYAADQLLAEVTSTNGDIAGGTTGHTMVGGRKTSGSWSNFLNADLDELRVVDYEMSADEIRETWRRLSIHQPNGVAMLAGLSPPGSRWYRNPGNQIAGMVKTAGELLGVAIAKIEELRENWLPDQAYTDFIARWESVLKIAPKPLDSLDTRRTRVVAFLSRLRGYSIPAIRQILSGPLALDPSDVQILTYSNRIIDSLSSIGSTRWYRGPTGTWSVVGGQAQVAAAMGTDFTQYPIAPCHLRMPVPSTNQPRPSAFGKGAVIAQVELASITSLDNQSLLGLHLFDRLSNDALWFGVQQAGTHRALGYYIYQNGIQTFVQLVASAPSLPIWLRVRPQTLQDSMFTPILGYSTTGPTTGFTETGGVIFTLNPPNNAGVGVIGGNQTGALQATVANFEMIGYDGARPFDWFVYRDPGLAGTPDMVGAQLALSSARPAHARAGVCENTVVLCGDPRDGLCARGPMGPP